MATELGKSEKIKTFSNNSVAMKWIGADKLGYHGKVGCLLVDLSSAPNILTEKNKTIVS